MARLGFELVRMGGGQTGVKGAIARNSTQKLVLFLFLCKFSKFQAKIIYVGPCRIRHGSKKHILAHLIRNVLANWDEKACFGTQG